MPSSSSKLRGKSNVIETIDDVNDLETYNVQVIRAESGIKYMVPCWLLKDDETALFQITGVISENSNISAYGTAGSEDDLWKSFMNIKLDYVPLPETIKMEYLCEKVNTLVEDFIDDPSFKIYRLPMKWTDIHFRGEFIFYGTKGEDLNYYGTLNDYKKEDMPDPENWFKVY